MKSILDKTFRYVPSSQTDLRKTFAKARRKLVAESQEKPKNVQPMKRVNERS